ncbi:MAG: hypothetical protein JST06_04550 [Bacteroidetes bacterium]|nr:hypothetical protein [Bacteroidota bacterium]MBS1628867.1 hypothetical protein [Bacteroidota bacterium]
MEQTSMGAEGFEHSQWLSSLDQYKEELGSLKGRLTEISRQNISHEAAIELEQFENRFRVQRDNIDRLRHDIKQNRNVYRDLDAHQQAPSETEAAYALLGEAFQAEVQAVQELSSAFQQFSGLLS